MGILSPIPTDPPARCKIGQPLENGAPGWIGQGRKKLVRCNEQNRGQVCQSQSELLHCGDHATAGL
jgi:hypothetical protein